MISPIAITGAGGFIGRRTVDGARNAGLEVRALLRRANAAQPHWQTDQGIDVVNADLAQATNLAAHMEGVQAVIHCAAAMRGDHARDTLAASSALINAVVAAKVPHVVLAGSIAVYDAASLPDHAVLNETCATNTHGRDAYAQAKLAQEDLFRTAAAKHGFGLTVLRLGAVWGATRLFNAHLGPTKGPVLFKIDTGGELPLCDVTLAAECLVKASQSSMPLGTLNILDDDRPKRTDYLAQLRKSGWPKITAPVPLPIMRLAAALTPDTPSMPGLLRRPTLEARHKPLTYSNAEMHKRLGPVTMLPFETAMVAAIKTEQDQAK